MASSHIKRIATAVAACKMVKSPFENEMVRGGKI
jgi:hypothetical protein